MADESTTVDVLSLEDFHATLATRLTEANGLLTTLTTSLATAPQLGTFQDASAEADRYATLRDEHAGGVQRLIDAITAAQTATATIMSNYQTTEDRNAANASDISSTLSPVGQVLDGVLNGGRTDAR